ncbi:MAG: hypothetical protein CR982_08255 [Candidatus Cloacimonadota bacterium]|nr:MAG: hypothetical protein CR982_08255 [Candidatus Cloacimonadota bacterium]PIE79044.1 MAG: hypothetical protein CSA15_04700 [Candidatus Delongbacteria bacterium]
MKRGVILNLLIILLISCTSKKDAKTLYFNGDIITMETERPQYVEALVENEGKIVFVGSLKEAEEIFKVDCKIDLKGKVMLPGFIDPHSHFANVSNAMGQVNLSPPPVGNTTNIPQLLDKIKRYKVDNKISDGGVFGLDAKRDSHYLDD